MSRDDWTILVTGAAGRIGRAAVRELAGRGYRVRAFDVVRRERNGRRRRGEHHRPRGRAAGRAGNRRADSPRRDAR